MTGRAQYSLGEEVRTKSGWSKDLSAVLSVRLSATEVAELEGLGRSTGKSISQLIREAVRQFAEATAAEPRVNGSVMVDNLTLSWESGVPSQATSGPLVTQIP